MIGLEATRILTTHGRLEELRRHAQERRSIASAREESHERAGVTPRYESRFTWDLPSGRGASKRAWFLRRNPVARRHDAADRGSKRNDPA